MLACRSTMSACQIAMFKPPIGTVALPDHDVKLPIDNIGLPDHDVGPPIDNIGLSDRDTRPPIDIVGPPHDDVALTTHLASLSGQEDRVTADV